MIKRKTVGYIIAAYIILNSNVSFAQDPSELSKETILNTNTEIMLESGENNENLEYNTDKSNINSKEDSQVETSIQIDNTDKELKDSVDDINKEIVNSQIDFKSVNEQYVTNSELIQNKIVGESRVTKVNVQVDKVSPQWPGSPIQITAIAEGSQNSIYQFYIYEEGVWKLLQGYSSNNKCIWTPAKVGTYKISVHAKDINSNEKYESFYAFDYKSIESKVAKVNVQVDKVSPQWVGEPTTITAMAEGSKSPLYRFWIYEDNTWKLLQDYSSNNKVTWTPTKSGTYKISVHAKDTDSNEKYESYSAFDYKVIESKVKKVSMQVSKSSPQWVGDPTTITAIADGSKNPVYRFWLYEDNTWKLLQDYSSNNKYTWIPSKQGEYKISVHAKDIDSNEKYELYSAFDYTAKESKVSKVNVQVSKSSPQWVGDPTTITAIADGSKNPVYRFWIYEDNTWKLLQDYSSNNKVTWTPTKSGIYKISVHAKDTDSNEKYESYSAFDYKAIESKVTKLSVNLDKSSPQLSGNLITITATANGSKNPVYRFYISENGVWRLVQDYSSNNKYTWKPTKAGTYKISIHAKDLNSKAEYESYNAFNYTIATSNNKMITTSSLNLRTGDSTSYSTILTIPAGSQVTVLERLSNGWIKVYYGGKTGFVSSDYLKGLYNYDKFNSNITAFMNENYVVSDTDYVVITSLRNKETYVFKGKSNNWSLVYKWACDIGTPSTPTIKGEYKISGRKPGFGDYRTYQVKYATRIYGGYYYHSILYNVSGTRIIDHTLDDGKGDAVSHGCIRLKPENAKWIYKNISDKTKVIIR